MLVDSNITLLDNQRAKQSQYNFYSKKALESNNLTAVDIKSVMNHYKKEMSSADCIKFKPITQSQLLNDLPPTQSFSNGPKPGYEKSNELFYKILRGDTKLVRSLLEANNFRFSDSHDWNILWSSSSCKSFLYEGLNEYQRINHFPSSYEITRKDRLCFNIMKMQEKFGRSGIYDIVPDTYILPN